MNEKIKECILRDDVERYFSLFVDENKHIFYKISLDLILPTYKMLIQNLSNIKNIILLEHLISKHYEFIFSKEDLNVINGDTLKKIYMLVDQMVKKIESKAIDMNGALSLGLDFHLAIIKKMFTKRR
jgi:hypothetical protein